MGARAPDAPSLLRVAFEELHLNGVARRRREAEMAEGVRGEHSAAGRALHETLLDEEGLDDLLDRVARLRQSGGDGLDADRAAAETDCDGIEIAVIHGVEP